MPKHKKTARDADHNVAFVTEMRKYFEETSARLAEASAIAERVREISSAFLASSIGSAEKSGENGTLPARRPRNPAGGGRRQRREKPARAPGGRACGCAARGKHRKGCREAASGGEHRHLQCIDCDHRYGSPLPIEEAKEQGCPKCGGVMLVEK